MPNDDPVPGPLRVLASKHPCLRAFARGRDGVREMFNDPHAGFYGECYDLAVAMKRLLGTGEYVVMQGRGRDATIYHVLLRIDGCLIDAAGIHDQKQYETSSPDLQLRVATAGEIESLVEFSVVAWMARRLMIA